MVTKVKKLTGKKIALFVIGGVLVGGIVGVGFYFMEARTKKTVEKINTAAGGSKSETEQGGESKSGSGIQDLPAKVDPNEPPKSEKETSSPNQATDNAASLILDKPVAGAVLSKDRTFSGKARNTGGKIYYSLYGEQSGLVAEGSVAVSGDTGAYVNFKGSVSFGRKPIPGDSGRLYFYVFQDNVKKEMAKLEVTI